jgi:hypothetical protein
MPGFLCLYRYLGISFYLMTIKIAAIGIEKPGGMVTPCAEAIQLPRWFGLMLFVWIGDDDEFDDDEFRGAG